MCRLRISKLLDLLRYEIDIPSGNVAVPLHDQVDPNLKQCPSNSFRPIYAQSNQRSFVLSAANARARRGRESIFSISNVLPSLRCNALHRSTEFQARDLIEVFVHNLNYTVSVRPH